MKILKYVKISEQNLREISEEIFLGFGVKKEQAEVVVDVLLSAELRGKNSHGVIKMVNNYLPSIINKNININSEPKILKDDAFYTQLDANYTLGHYASYIAVNEAIKKNENSAITIASVKNSTHFGYAGYYSLMAAKKGLIGITITNGAPAVPINGGSKPIFGTNAISLAFPDLLDEKNHILIDLALSSTSLGSLFMASKKHKEVKADLAAEYLLKNLKISKDELINPLEIYKERLIAPIGAYDSANQFKGSLLSLIVEILLGLLFGGNFSFNHENGEADHLFLILDPIHFNDKENIIGKFLELIHILDTLEVMQGTEKFRVPGFQSNRCETIFKNDGIPILEEVWLELKNILSQMHKKENPIMTSIGSD